MIKSRVLSNIIFHLLPYYEQFITSRIVEQAEKTNTLFCQSIVEWEQYFVITLSYIYKVS